MRERADVEGRAAAKAFLLLTREMVSITSLASQGEGQLHSKSDPQQRASKDKKASDIITFSHV